MELIKQDSKASLRKRLTWSLSISNDLGTIPRIEVTWLPLGWWALDYGNLIYNTAVLRQTPVAKAYYFFQDDLKDSSDMELINSFCFRYHVLTFIRDSDETGLHCLLNNTHDITLDLPIVNPSWMLTSSRITYPSLGVNLTPAGNNISRNHQQTVIHFQNQGDNTLSKVTFIWILGMSYYILKRTHASDGNWSKLLHETRSKKVSIKQTQPHLT